MSNTVRKYLNSFAPNANFDSLVDWPPDAFAITASLLVASGAYCSAVTISSTRNGSLVSPSATSSAGKDWRAAAGAGRRAPLSIRKRWAFLKKRLNVELTRISKNPDLTAMLLEVMACADEACAGIGFPIDSPEATDNFHKMVFELLAEKQGTLCRNISDAAVRVLPKAHTPQVGMTLRSLTNNLALCRVGEVELGWYPISSKLGVDGANNAQSLNLLVVPYPSKVEPSWFKPSKVHSLWRYPVPSEFGFFRYDPPPAMPWIQGEFESVLQKAKSVDSRVDGVVFPEGSFSTKEEFEFAYMLVTRHFPEAFLLAGMSLTPIVGGAGEGVTRNHLRYAVPIDQNSVCLFEQSKHHRWKLDRGQIERYNFDRLKVGVDWWEHIDISDRTLHFFSTKSKLTFCFLICEDLARQEPVAPMVRAVAPHLVIALLQDGPQLKERWPARYASVLTEDPGSAVLTVTSLGMTLCGPDLDWPPDGACIGLWRDRGAVKELRLEKGHRAMLLKLRGERKTEFSADGRSNPDASGLYLKESLQVE